MAAKPKSLALGGGHTAGIFADMSVDGPEIGTLVTVVDRAKNLPNRKTIGKQDPYCAARLGKEAKKTATDIRGGQTPKWDQELRFTVHDSPDYYQLKISVFTDDKKTDLIGEAWIDLKSIIVPGGGQSDMWQSLTCRGKYAGEIRLEITYYDSRPKPDRQPARKRQLPASDRDASVKQRAPMGRRPLPSDPVTGEAPPLPAPSAPVMAGPSTPDHHHHQTPPRSHAFVPTQSPLQAVEYNTPSPQPPRQHHEPYSPSPQSAAARVDGPRPEQRSREALSTPPRRCDERGHCQKASVSPYDQADLRSQHPPLPEHYHELPAGGDIDDARPPPPPAHRSRQSSDSQELVQRSVYDASPQKMAPSTPMRHDVLKNEAHRYSTATYPGRPTFRPYEPPVPTSNPAVPLDSSPFSSSPFSSSPPRYRSYDPAGDPQHRPMQATVEDAPESPPGTLTGAYRHGVPRVGSHDEMMFVMKPFPVPFDPNRSPGAPWHALAQLPARGPGSVQGLNGSVSQQDLKSALVPAYHLYSGQGQRSSPRHELELSHTRNSPSYYPPELPASLSHGTDSGLSREMAERIYEERGNDCRHIFPQAETPTRGRRRSEGLPPAYGSYSPGHAPNAREGRSEITYWGGPENPIPRPRSGSPKPSPSPQHMIPRKSVSPTPESRMICDVPFSPDSYDALNPMVASSREAEESSERIDPDAKIIMHDGREVDPSDHLPMESWAPEPEPKAGQRPASPEPRARPSPSGAQPMPRSGRRPLRVAGPQHNTSAPAPLYTYGEGPWTPPAPASAGRNRLQKKTDRGGSAGPPAAMSSPLAPVSTDNFQDRTGPYTPPSRPRRGGSWDYANENHAPYGGVGPPIPAKVPLQLTSGGGFGGDQALIAEMQSIDIGCGRSRRRGGY